MNIEIIKRANTKNIGKEIEYFKEIDSTHKYAKKIVAKQKANGKVIIAETQTEGIGTKGRKWYTGENKNIAMTILLKPQCTIQDLENITVKIAECMEKTVEELYKIRLEIKEPNDLMLCQKKIGGILTEFATMAGKIQYLLISLGMNINEEQFSKETEMIATSLKKEYGKTFKREEIIKKFIENLEKEIDV